MSLSWAVDEAAPTALTVFDPEHESTTHWITIDTARARDLGDCV